MPYLALGGCFSHLSGRATCKQKKQCTQHDSKDHLTYRSRNAFHHVSLFEHYCADCNLKENSPGLPTGFFKGSIKNTPEHAEIIAGLQTTVNAKTL